MNYTDVMNGSSGHKAAGFCRATVCSQLGFLIGVAVQREANPLQEQKPLWDASVVEALGGDTGVAERVEYDLDELVRGYAAAFMSLNEHCNRPNPEDGKKDDYLRSRFLKTPKDLVDRSISTSPRIRKQVQHAQAQGAMLKVDSTARVEAIMAEAHKQVDAILERVNKDFVTALQSLRTTQNSVEEWNNIALEAMANAKENTALRIKNSAKAYLAALAEKQKQGKFVSVDSGIYALAQ